MRFIFEIIGIAGDIQSAVELTELITTKAKVFWTVMTGVFAFLFLIFLILSLIIYLRARNTYVKNNETLENFTIKKSGKIYEKYFPSSDITIYRILIMIIIGGEALVSIIAAIIQLVLYLYYGQ